MKFTAISKHVILIWNRFSPHLSDTCNWPSYDTAMYTRCRKSCPRKIVLTAPLLVVWQMWLGPLSKTILYDH